MKIQLFDNQQNRFFGVHDVHDLYTIFRAIVYALKIDSQIVMRAGRDGHDFPRVFGGGYFFRIFFYIGIENGKKSCPSRPEIVRH